MPGFKIDARGCGGGGGSNTGPDPNQETARKHRYKLEVLQPMERVKLLAWKCSRPVMEADKVVIHHGQNEISVPGKHRWLPINVTFYEAVDSVDLTAQYLEEWHARKTVLVRQSRTGSQSDYKKECELQMLDGRGDPVWTYRLKDVWPLKVEPSELSYADSDIADITVTLEIGAAIGEAS